MSTSTNTTTTPQKDPPPSDKQQPLGPPTSPTTTKPPNRDLPACFTETHNVLTSTMNDLPGYRIVRLLGAVYGLTVRSRNWGVDIGALLRSVVGGEIALFTRLMYAARNEAVERLIGEVLARGGNAVVALRFDTSPQGTFSQVCAYGTACLVEKID